MDAIISELFEEVAYCQALEAVAEAEAALIRSPRTASTAFTASQVRFSFNSAVALQLPSSRKQRQFLVSIDG